MVSAYPRCLLTLSLSQLALWLNAFDIAFLNGFSVL